MWTMFAANALSSTAFIGAVTVASLVAESLLGSARLAGLPSTAATVGTAAGALALGAVGAISAISALTPTKIHTFVHR